jgi:diaminobutyrate-2-oxoglutarate transaminase
MATTAKAAFLEALERRVLAPRELNYKVMFTGPTGTNAVEAALKLARKVKERTHVVAFTNGFHGMTMGSLSLTGNAFKRKGAGVPLGHVTHMPFDGYFEDEIDTLDVLQGQLEDTSSGLDRPAAFVLETVQAEGGVNVASRRWLRRLARLARRFDALLVVDDIQVGCGRTGPFFSFEPAGIAPDVVCLSKSLSGYGLPFAITLLKPELDCFAPGEHNGTFRGHNLAFVTAKAALDRYWSTNDLELEVRRKAHTITSMLAPSVRLVGGTLRGRGMIQGIELPDPERAALVARTAFQRGLIVETAGPQDEVVKILPPLTIDDADLHAGLEILREALLAVHQPDQPVAASSYGSVDGRTG